MNWDLLKSRCVAFWGPGLQCSGRGRGHGIIIKLEAKVYENPVPNVQLLRFPGRLPLHPTPSRPFRHTSGWKPWCMATSSLRHDGFHGDFQGLICGFQMEKCWVASIYGSTGIVLDWQRKKGVCCLMPLPFPLLSHTSGCRVWHRPSSSWITTGSFLVAQCQCNVSHYLYCCVFIYSCIFIFLWDPQTSVCDMIIWCAVHFNRQRILASGEEWANKSRCSPSPTKIWGVAPVSFSMVKKREEVKQKIYRGQENWLYIKSHCAMFRETSTVLQEGKRERDRDRPGEVSEPVPFKIYINPCAELIESSYLLN